MTSRKIDIIPIPANTYKQSESLLFDCFNTNIQLVNSQLLLAVQQLSEDARPKSAIYNKLNVLIENDASIPFEVYNSKELGVILRQFEIGLNKSFYAPIVAVTHIFFKYGEMSNIESAQVEQEDVEDIIDRDDYKSFIRPDMLQLYNFINDWKKQPQDQAMTLICGSKKLQLNNKNNWMFTAINEYLDEHLRIASVEEASLELEKDYSTKTGRKSNKYQTILILGIDRLFQALTQSEEISNDECRFIRSYLKYLGIPISVDDFEHDDDLKNIRSRIRYLRKADYTPNWLDQHDTPYRESYS